MRLLQRDKQGRVLREVCPVLPCVLLYDGSVATSPQHFEQFRHAFNGFLRVLKRDGDAACIVSVASQCATAQPLQELAFEPVCACLLGPLQEGGARLSKAHVNAAVRSAEEHGVEAALRGRTALSPLVLVLSRGSGGEVSLRSSATVLSLGARDVALGQFLADSARYLISRIDEELAP